MTRAFPVFEAEREASVLLPEGGLLVAFDEVGRGCVAGPVVAGCTLWRPGTPTDAQKRLLPLVDDSKALRPAARERIVREFDVPCVTLFDPAPGEPHAVQASTLVAPHAPARRFEDLVSKTSALGAVKPRRAGARAPALPRDGFVCVAAGLGFAPAEEIDAHDIWTCVQLAMARALAQASAAFPTPPQGAELLIVVDGHCGVKVAPEHAQARQLTCVKGDSRFVSLGLSSILAKVARDALMCEAALAHPEYGFEKHKGYGTAAHFEALRRHAPMSLHRRTFLRSLTEV